MGKLITSAKNFSELANAVRSGSACIAVTQLAGLEASVPHPFFGSLVVEGEACEMILRTVNPGAHQLSSKLCWSDPNKEERFEELDCILDGHLKVKLKEARFGNSQMNSSTGLSLVLEFNEISCGQSMDMDAPADDIRMTSKIAHTELKYKNAGYSNMRECSLDGEIVQSWKRNALGGEVAPYRYKIEQEGEDLILIAQLMDGETSVSAECDSRFMAALIVTFVWLNGGHPYAYYRSLQRNGKFVEECLQKARKFPRSKDSLIRSSTDGRVAAEIMKCGIQFFSTESNFAKDLRLFLWEYRDATAEGAISMGQLLQACSLLEGLIGLTLRHPMQLSKSAIDKLTTPWAQNTKNGTAEGKFYRANSHLGFDWDTQLQPVFQTWKKVRGALAHGNLAEMEQHSGGNLIDCYCQIIQAFNAIALRLIGYKGGVMMDKGWFAAGD